MSSDEQVDWAGITNSWKQTHWLLAFGLFGQGVAAIVLVATNTSVWNTTVYPSESTQAKTGNLNIAGLTPAILLFSFLLPAWNLMVGGNKAVEDLQKFHIDIRRSTVQAFVSVPALIALSCLVGIHRITEIFVLVSTAAVAQLLLAANNGRVHDNMSRGTVLLSSALILVLDWIVLFINYFENVKHLKPSVHVSLWGLFAIQLLFLYLALGVYWDARKREFALERVANREIFSSWLLFVQASLIAWAILGDSIQ